MEGWAAELASGRPDAAWDLFLDRYRRLIFAAIRHYAQDYDDVMDVFARVCEALREDDLRRLRTYVAQPDHRARFSTWLVTVVRHVTVDWFRHRDGRRRLSVVAEELPAADVARILGLPNAKAVHNRVYRALAAARARLAQVGVGRGDV